MSWQTSFTYYAALQFRPEKGDCVLTVQRGDLFRSSFISLFQQPATSLQKRLVVTFVGEGLTGILKGTLTS